MNTNIIINNINKTDVNKSIHTNNKTLDNISICEVQHPFCYLPFLCLGMHNTWLGLGLFFNFQT